MKTAKFHVRNFIKISCAEFHQKSVIQSQRKNTSQGGESITYNMVLRIRSGGYRSLFMLKSTEHELKIVHAKIVNASYLASSLLINV